MSLTIKVNKNVEPRKSEKFNSIMRRTIDGNIIVDDHPSISIVVNPNEKKITAYPKDGFGDDVYYYQDLLFRQLARKGIIKRDSTQSGSAYGSMEASYPEPTEDIHVTHLILINIGKFILDVKPDVEFEKWLEDEHDRLLTDPTQEDSTELGEVPGKTNKGVVDSTHRIRRYLGGMSYY